MLKVNPRIVVKTSFNSVLKLSRALGLGNKLGAGVFPAACYLLFAVMLIFSGHHCLWTLSTLD